MKLIILFFFAFIFTTALGDIVWSYEGNTGPDAWPTFQNTSCGKDSQSPIDIVTKDALTNLSQFTTLDFIGYNGNYTDFLIKNNGHSVQINTRNSELRIRGAALNGDYVLEQFHFHWGETDSVGSEHRINNKTYPIELHLVHHGVAYASVSDAINYGQGVAVVGIFGEITDTNPSPAFDKLLQYFALIPYMGNSTNVTLFNVQDLLPSLGQYYRYNGSLTTPPCTEGVVWTVFSTPIKITSEQLTKFRGLYDTSADDHISENFRPLQPLNSRKLYASYANVNSKAESILPPGLTNIAIFMAASFLLLLH